MKRLRLLLYLVTLVLTFALFNPGLDAFGQEPGPPDPTPTAGDLAPPDTSSDPSVSENPASTEIATSIAEPTLSSDPEVHSSEAADETATAEPSPTPNETATQSPGNDELQSADETASNGTIKIFKQDQQARPVEHAGFTLFDENCDVAVSGEQFTDFDGVTIFTDLDPAATFCVKETTVPSGYLPPDPAYSLVTPSDTASGPLDTVVWVQNQRIDEADPVAPGTVRIGAYRCTIPALDDQRMIFDIFYNDNPSAVSASGTDCARTYLEGQIRAVGATDWTGFQTVESDSTEITDLAPGNYEIRTFDPASDWVPFQVLSNGSTTIVIQIFDFPSTFSIRKVDPTGMSVAGARFTFYDESCATPLSPEFFSNAGPMEVDLPYGTYCLIETTVPPGYDGSEPQIVTVTRDGPNQATFVNTPRSDVGAVTIVKRDQFDQPVENAGFTLFDYQITNDGETRICTQSIVASEQFTDGNGVTIFSGLDPLGSYCLRETTIPRGYEGDPERTYQVIWAAGAGTAAIDTSMRIVNQRVGGGSNPDTLSIPILKYFCPVTQVADERVSFDVFRFQVPQVNSAATEANDGSCIPGVATFEVQFIGYQDQPLEYLGTTEPVQVSTDASGLLILEDIPIKVERANSGTVVPADLRIREVLPTTTDWFVYQGRPGYRLTVVVQNFVTELPIVPTGSLYLEKFYCPAKESNTVFAPLNELPADVAATCRGGAANFAIYPFKRGEPMLVATDDKGKLTVSDLPAGTHLLKELGTGATTEFTIVAGQTTTLNAINFEATGEPGGGDGHKPPSTSGASPVSLPNTGTGSSVSASSWGFFGWGTAIMLVLLALSQVPMRRTFRASRK